MGQMVEIIEAEPFRRGIDLIQPVVIGSISTAVFAISVDEIQQRAADPENRRRFDRFSVAGIFLCPQIKRTFQCRLCINDASRHGRSTGAMLFDETGCMTARFGIQQIINIPLTIKGDLLALVPRDRDESHLTENDVQLFGVGMGVFDEFEPIRASGIHLADRGLRGVMRVRAHIFSSDNCVISP